MLYSDEAWRLATKTEPDTPGQQARFAAAMDFAGAHADWYNREKIERLFGREWEVSMCAPITADGGYLGARLRRRPSAA